MSENLKLPAKLENFEVCMNFIEERLERLRLDIRNISKIMTASEEIVVNIIHYAYKNGEGDLEIIIDDYEDHAVLTFLDGGFPFNPLEKRDVDTSLSVHEREIGGLGIFMVKKLMDEVIYEYREGKNILKIFKNKLTV